METDLTIVSEFWGSDEMIARRGKGIHWTEQPQVLAYMCQQMSGDPDVHWDLHFWKNYIRPQSHSLNVLSLGCGLGDLEISLMKRGNIKYMTACDVSERALILAKESAVQSGVDINFLHVDLNNPLFPENTYDIVVGSSCLHHVSNLEPLLFQVRRSMRANGILVINEYVGSNRFQFPLKQIELINQLFSLLPDKYRRRVSNPSNLKESVDFPSIQSLIDTVPSEAVRSADIVPLLQRFFRVYENRPFGDTILHFLLYDIAGNFCASNPNDRIIMDLLINTEKILIESGVLGSDFIYMVLG